MNLIFEQRENLIRINVKNVRSNGQVENSDVEQGQYYEI